MKRLLACLVIVAVAVAFAVPALAAENAPKAPKRPARGIIVKWDDATRSFTLRIGKGGHEVAFKWDEKTKIEGAPKIGQKVVVDYRKEGQNTVVAEKIAVEAPPAPAPAKK